MDDFFKEWGLPILFGVVVYSVFKPKDNGTGTNAGGGAGAGTNTGASTGTGGGGTIQPPTYTYDCRNISCVDTLSLGVSREEVKYLKQAINQLRYKLVNEYFNQLSSSAQNNLLDLQNYPYLDTNDPVFNNNLSTQVYGLTGMWSGSLLNLIQAAKHKIAIELSYASPLVQEIDGIIQEMQNTMFL